MKKLVIAAMLVMGLGTYPAFAAEGDLTVNVDPDTLNLQSKGNYVTVYVTSATVALADILENAAIIGTIPETTGALPIAPVSGAIEDGEVVFKFDRAAVQAVCALPQTTLILGWETLGGGDGVIPKFSFSNIEISGGPTPTSIVIGNVSDATWMNIGITSGGGVFFTYVVVYASNIPVAYAVVDASSLEGSYDLSQFLPADYLTDVRLDISSDGTVTIEGIDFTSDSSPYGTQGGGTEEISGSDTIRVINEGGKK